MQPGGVCRRELEQWPELRSVLRQLEQLAVQLQRLPPGPSFNDNLNI